MALMSAGMPWTEASNKFELPLRIHTSFTFLIVLEVSLKAALKETSTSSLVPPSYSIWMRQSRTLNALR